MIVGINRICAEAERTPLAKSLKLRHGFQRIAFADKLKELALGTDPIHWNKSCDIPVRLSALVAGLGWDRAKEFRRSGSTSNA